MVVRQKSLQQTRRWIPYVVNRGKKTTNSEIKIYIVKSKEKPRKIAVIIPKKIDNRAVIRNKLRRRTREIVSKLLQSFDTPYDSVIFFQKGAEKLSFQELKKKITRLFNVLTTKY